MNIIGIRTGFPGLLVQTESSIIMNGLNPPGHHPITEQLMVPDQLVGLIIGKNGEQINRIQTETGCRVQIVPHSIGTNERPCTLHGNPLQVQMARTKLNEIIVRGGPRENGQNFSNESHIQYNNDYQVTDQITVEMMIPPDKCGLIIGKGGNTLKNMMQEHSVKLHLVQDSAEVTKDEKPLKIIGTKHAVDEARRAIMFLMAQKDGNKLSPLTGGKPTIEVSVPKAAVGVVIGRGGENISRIQTETGTRIQFKPDDPNLDSRGCVISGTQEACHAAQEKIKDIAAAKLAEQGQIGPVPVQFDNQFGQAGSHTVDYQVPANRAGVVIGKGGENIRLIKEKSGAFVQIEKSNGTDHEKDPSWKTFIIRGNPSQIDEAQRLIQEKAGVPPQTQSLPTNQSMHTYHHGDGPGTPLGTPGTPIAHAHTPINSMINQMSSMNLGNSGTPQPGPPHPNQQGGMWGTPDHNNSTDSMNWYHQMYPQQANQAQYPHNWNSQAMHQSPQGRLQTGGQAGQSQDYSRQWQEYWKHMQADPNSQPQGHPHVQYSAHGQAMSSNNGNSQGGEGQGQWHGDGRYATYMNQSQGYPAYPGYPTQDHGLIYHGAGAAPPMHHHHSYESSGSAHASQLSINQNSLASLDYPLHDEQDNSPITTARYSPQSQ